ncbi:MAG: hypothetical protein ACJAYG_002215 [Oceanicoccus sp.]|jgi:hypothetical protein
MIISKPNIGGLRKLAIQALLAASDVVVVKLDIATSKLYFNDFY